MLLVATSLLGVAERQRVRWAAALIFGIGSWLCVDEAGLSLLVPYNDLLSILLLTAFGLAFFEGTTNAGSLLTRKGGGHLPPSP